MAPLDIVKSAWKRVRMVALNTARLLLLALCKVISSGKRADAIHRERLVEVSVQRNVCGPKK